MAIGSSKCFQEGIKFLSNEQQFVLDVPRWLFSYAPAIIGGVIEYIRQRRHFATAKYYGARAVVDSLARAQRPRRYALGDNPNRSRKAVVR